MKALAVVSLPFFALLLTGCPPTGVVCAAGTVRCGAGCVDPTSDSRNCGACGTACPTAQVCVSGGCACNQGAVSCSGECVVLATDPKHCGFDAGTCGRACAGNDVCETGECRASCQLGVSTRCGNSCVDLRTDPAHCGGCAVACQNSQTCHAGRCSFDLVAACYTSGQVVGLNSGSENKGPSAPLGTSPAALAQYGSVLLSADGTDQKLYQARLALTDGGVFVPLSRENVTGAVPNQVVVDPPFVYVVNAGSGTLQVLRNDGGAEPDDAGLALLTIAELPLGANTYPEGAVKVGSALWIPLYGGYGAAAAAAGQKVLKVDVSNPGAPAVVGTVSLSGLDLKPFDGGAPVARPYAIISHRGSVYVVLSNLHPDTYAPEGPGLLAKINPADAGISLIDLGADACRNPLWLASDGTHLVVSCGGAAVYSGPPTYALVKAEFASVVLLDEQDVRRSVWTPGCPAAADGGQGCAPILLSRFALAGSRVYLGDQNGGRLFVLEISGNTLGERRGYYGDAGAAIAVCAPDPITGIANVSDVLAIP